MTKSIRKIFISSIFMLFSTRPVLAEIKQLRIYNNCEHHIRVVLALAKYYPCGGKECSEEYEMGFWELAPFENKGIRDHNGDPIMMIVSPFRDILYYAESTNDFDHNHNHIWSGREIHTTDDAFRLPDGSRPHYIRYHLGENSTTLKIECPH